MATKDAADRYIWVRYRATCPRCGYTWTRETMDDRRACCPDCDHHYYHNDGRARYRDGAEVVRRG